jgi:hypothetical protein
VHRVAAVNAAHIVMLWPEVRPFIEDALRRDGSDRYLPDDVLLLLIEGKAALWIAWRGREIDAAIITQILQYPRCKDCRIWLIGGRNLRGWAYKARDAIEQFARFNGCRYVSGGLRRGWLRIGGSGWQEAGVNIEKRL